jgi:hypothetical protein
VDGVPLKRNSVTHFLSGEIKMAAIPHANVSGVLQKAPAAAAVAASPMSHTVLVLLQQAVPYSRCPYPLQSLVHNNSLCSQQRTSFAAAERYT